QRLAPIKAQIANLQEQVARLTVAKRPLLLVITNDQMIDAVSAQVEPHLRREDLEELAELILRRIDHVDLVRNAPQEGVVDQVLGFEVGREDDKLIERHLYLCPVRQR